SIERGGFGIQNANVVRELPGTIDNDAPLVLGSDGTKPAFAGSIADFRVYDRVLSEEEAQLAAVWPEVEEAKGKAPQQLSEAERGALRTCYAVEADPEYGARMAELDKVNAGRREIQNRADTAIVMQERPNSKATAHVLFRGMYDQPREEVE